MARHYVSGARSARIRILRAAVAEANSYDRRGAYSPAVGYEIRKQARELAKQWRIAPKHVEGLSREW